MVKAIRVQPDCFQGPRVPLASMIAARHTSSSPSPKILVVDPDASSRGQYAQLLGLLETEIVHSPDGRDALVQVLEHPFALVILETEVPLIDGYSLCEVIRSDALVGSIPIMVVTADGRPNALRRALSAGADVALAKPCPGDELSLQAKRLLGGAERRDRHVAAAVEEPPPPALEDGGAKTRGVKSRSHKRYETTQPPKAPPVLRCPSCDRALVYAFSHVGGVSERESEQWDYFMCSGTCGQFRYRHRTRKIQRV